MERKEEVGEGGGGNCSRQTQEWRSASGGGSSVDSARIAGTSTVGREIAARRAYPPRPASSCMYQL